MKSRISIIFLIAMLSLGFTAQVSAASESNAAISTIHLNSTDWLGSLKLDKKQLEAIRTAVEKALTAPIDDGQQCGKVYLDCVARAAREWTVDGNKYREIVVNIHTVGHSSRAVGQTNGKWPTVAIN